MLSSFIKEIKVKVKEKIEWQATKPPPGLSVKSKLLRTASQLLGKRSHQSLTSKNITQLLAHVQHLLNEEATVLLRIVSTLKALTISL